MSKYNFFSAVFFSAMALASVGLYVTGGFGEGWVGVLIGLGAMALNSWVASQAWREIVLENSK